jgi:putative membrane protein
VNDPAVPDEASSDASRLTDSAPRRTFLAAERTYLAWIRTGLAVLALAIAVGRLLPALLGTPAAAFTVLGVAYGLFGIYLIVFAALRWRAVRRALEADRPIPTEGAAILTVSLSAAVLAVATLVVMVVVK